MPRAQRPIYSLLIANTLSFMAEGVALVAIPWFVLELTGSYAKMGVVGFFTVLPRVIATFLGGQLVDRLGFRVSSVISDLLSGVSVCGIPILYATGNLSFFWLVVLVVVGAAFDGPGATAKEAMVPELAELGGIDLDRINAFFQGARRLSGFIGPVMAGFLVAAIGTSNVLWVNAVVFGLSALIITTLIPPLQVKDEEDSTDPVTFWSNTMFGFRFILQHRLLIWLAGMLCFMNFLEAPFATVVVPALVREQYGSAERLGILFGSHGIGAVISTIVFSAIAPRLSRRKTFITCFLLISPLSLLLAAAPPYPFAIFIFLVMGLMAGPINPILMSVRQERVPTKYRARVFGSLTAMAFIAIPLGQLIGGFLIEWIGVRMFLASVSCIYMAVVVSFFFAPVLREMDRRAPLMELSISQQSPEAERG